MAEQTMVERVGDAIARVRHAKGLEATPMDYAHAAIEAMRIPTNVMVVAAEDVNMPPCDDYSGGEPLLDYVIKEAWNVMINAAIKE